MADYNADDLYGGYEYDGNQAVTFSSLHAIISNLRVGAAQIEAASINDAHIQYLSGKVITIDADTTFAEGYDPTEIEGATRNLLRNSSDEKTSVNEFLRYADLAPIINANGLVEYTVSFDLKVPVAGPVQVYSQNGSGAKYGFSQNVNATTEYKRFSVTFVPTLADNSQTESWLAFYGTYGTGRIPMVKNVKVALGSKATEWTPAPEDQVLLSKLYNGVKIDSASGFTATRSDGLARSIMNATEGIKLQKWVAGAWADSLYADTDGNLIFRGFLKIEESQYTSRVYIERGYMRVDNGTGGGRVATVQEGKFTAYDDGNFHAITIDGNHIGFLDRHPETLRGEVASISFDRDWNMYLNGNVHAGTIYTDNWFRSLGDTGWYNATYDGGWYMIDSTWIRSYGGKHVYLGSAAIAAGTFVGSANNYVLSLGWGEGKIDLQNGAARFGRDDSNYFLATAGRCAVYVNGGQKVSWQSLPKVTIEPSGDGIKDGNEFGVNNSGSMQPSLEDFIITELDGTHEIRLDEKYVKFVEGFFVQVFEGNARIVSKSSSSFVVEGQGEVAFLVKGIQKGKRDLAGYGFKRVDMDGDGRYEEDFMPVYRDPTFNQCLVPASY